MDKLITWYNELNIRTLHSLKNDEEYQKIVELTSFLYLHFDNVTFPQRMFHINNNKFDIQKCEICGEHVKWKNGRGYNKTCSKTCHDIYLQSVVIYKHSNDLKQQMSVDVKNRFEINGEEIKEKSRKTCNEKYGVDNFSQTNDFIEKSIKSNLEKYGSEWNQQTEKSKIENRKRNFENSQNTIAIRYIIEQGYNVIDRITYTFQTCYNIKCLKCNEIFEISHNQILHRKSRNQEICTNCNPIQKPYSFAEKELSEFLKSIYSGKIIQNDRKLINPYELDIYIPDLNLAIEYNGLYWHSDLYKPDNYHLQKTNLCNEKGIRLIHIFEDNWLYKTDICKSILQTAISPQLNQKIFARKCEIKEINLDNTNKFLEENHINGRIMTQSICYGLYYNNELVSLMSFKGNILQRYAIKLNTTIIGGAEKLFKKANLQNCITYCDISLFSGKIYERLGFQFVRRSIPNFMFVNIDEKLNGYYKRISKQSIRKYRTDYKRENDTMPRIYNCGIDVYRF